MPLALVTGATAGIGRGFAERLARDGHDLVLIARSRDRLDQLAADLTAAHGVQVKVLAADLGTTIGCRTVEDRIASDPPVDLLVNNAGIGLGAPFLHNGIEAEERLLALNVRAVLRLTHAVLPGMIERRSGGIVNVASVAALGPGWLASTYPPSKSWVLAFTESVGRARQVRAAGVRMMALLPGYTRTEFHDRGHIDDSHVPGWLWLPTHRVVTAALRDLDRGKRVSVPSLRYKATAWALRHLPRPLLQPFFWEPDAPAARDIPS